MPDQQNGSSPFDQLGRATDDVRPEDGVVDAVMARVTAVAASSSAEPLQALASLTAELCPDDGLADEVMRRVQTIPRRNAGGWFSAEGMVRSGRAALLMAAAVAAGFLVYGSYAERQLYDDGVAAVAPVEASE
jgi:hypothetical protein